MHNIAVLLFLEAGQRGNLLQKSVPIRVQYGCMKKMIIPGVAFLFLLAVLSTTDPNRLPTFMLIAPFGVIFVLLFSLILPAMRRKGMSKGRRLQVATLLAAFPPLLLILQSLGQLSLRDIAVIAPFFILLYFYLSRLGAASEY